MAAERPLPWVESESLMRRSGLTAREAVTFSLRLLTAQTENASASPRALPSRRDVLERWDYALRPG